jgi:hypothetical protein
LLIDPFAVLQLDELVAVLLDRLTAVLSDKPSVGLSAKLEPGSCSIPKGRSMHIDVLWIFAGAL